MNMFMMWMMGNSVSLMTIMMLVYALYRPIGALMGMNKCRHLLDISACANIFFRFVDTTYFHTSYSGPHLIVLRSI